MGGASQVSVKSSEILGVECSFPRKRFYADILAPLLGASDSSLFAMFKAFLDESGMENNVSVVMGGIAGRKEECDLAADRWQNVLDVAGIKVPFHSIEFWNRTDGRLHGEYSHLSITDADLLAGLLCDIVNTPPLRPVGAAIAVVDFMELTEDERRWLTTNKRFGKDWGSQGSPSNPYFFIFQACTQVTATVVPAGEKVYFTFDRQDTFADRARRLYNEILAIKNETTEKMGEEVVFSSRASAVLLQAADFIAYLCRWALESRDSMPPAAHECFRRMAAPADSALYLLNHQGIDGVLKRCPFRKTFWEGLTKPDFVEQMRMNGYNVLAYKANDNYLSHHLKPSNVRVIGKLRLVAMGDDKALFSVVRVPDGDHRS